MSKMAQLEARIQAGGPDAVAAAEEYSGIWDDIQTARHLLPLLPLVQALMDSGSTLARLEAIKPLVIEGGKVLLKTDLSDSLPYRTLRYLSRQYARDPDAREIVDEWVKRFT